MMIICSDKHFRLSPEEKRQIELLTGGVPKVTTIAGLNRYLELAKLSYPGNSSEEILIRHLIEKCKVNFNE